MPKPRTENDKLSQTGCYGRIAESGGSEGRGKCPDSAETAHSLQFPRDGGGGPSRVDLSVEGPSRRKPPKKARTLTCVSPDFVPLTGGKRSTNRSDMPDVVDESNLERSVPVISLIEMDSDLSDTVSVDAQSIRD